MISCAKNREATVEILTSKMESLWEFLVMEGSPGSDFLDALFFLLGCKFELTNDSFFDGKTQKLSRLQTSDWSVDGYFAAVTVIILFFE